MGIQASPCSSSSSAGGGPHAHHLQASYQQPAAASPATGYGPRPRNALTEVTYSCSALARDPVRDPSSAACPCRVLYMCDMGMTGREGGEAAAARAGQPGVRPPDHPPPPGHPRRAGQEGRRPLVAEREHEEGTALHCTVPRPTRAMSVVFTFFFEFTDR